VFLRVSDLKQYVYCPRVVYYQYILPVDRKPTFKMDHGKVSEEELKRLEKRRKFKKYGLEGGVRHFGKWISSEKWQLNGEIDLLIEADGQYFPVDFKMTQGGVRENHRMQVAGYSLILEDMYDVPVEKGFIFLIPEEDVVPVIIDNRLKERCEEMLSKIRKMVEEEQIPEATPARNRCTDCEYRNYCRDIW